MVGAWKEWSDSMKEGDVFNFTEEMLKDTGDAHVDNITILVDNLITVKEKMKSELELLV